MELGNSTPYKLERFQKKIGCLIQIPNIGRGQLKYVGSVDTKPGLYAGVDLLANIGKNNGTFNGKKYFDTEYPQSGLFIQLQKVVELIENAKTQVNSNRIGNNGRRTPSTRRSLLSNDVAQVPQLLQSIPRSRMSSIGSVESTIVTRQTVNDPKSPTPVRNFKVSSRGSSVSLDNQLSNQIMAENEMEIDPPSSVERQDGRIIKDYELKLEKQQRKVLEYERLLNDQRMVLEEIKPAIDDYELEIQKLESERNRLTQQLNDERQEQRRRIQYFETEHGQLLDVVNQLHEELKENEVERKLSQVESSAVSQENNANINLEAIQSELEELRKYKQEMEHAKMKWDKEKDQLKMHNDSLSKEYAALNKELLTLATSSSGDQEIKDLKETIESLKIELAKAKEKDATKQVDFHNSVASTNEPIQSLPIYKPEHPVDEAAGRKLWCVLCEKSGHEHIDCPYQFSTASKPTISPARTDAFF